MEVLMAILMGIGLSTAVGFRVFVPVLLTSVLAKLSLISLNTNFEWISSTPALITFTIAAIVEITSLYIPVIDSLLKNLATPFAIIAGTLLTASFIYDMNPFVLWSLALIAGGGTATISHLTTSTIRTGSTLATGGIGNVLLSLIEGGLAIIMTISALFLPILSILFLILILILFTKLAKSFWKTRKNPK